MKQEDYIKRGIEKFKALDDKTQTDLIDYLVMKVVACGFIKEYTITTKVGFFSYMMPYWVHKTHLVFKCLFNPMLTTIMTSVILGLQTLEQEGEI